MELTPWRLKFKPGWDKHFKKFKKPTQEKILKKLRQMEQPLHARSLHTVNYLVEEAGQHRIAFIQDEKEKTKYIHFIGNHKQYEKWYNKQ